MSKDPYFVLKDVTPQTIGKTPFSAGDEVVGVGSRTKPRTVHGYFAGKEDDRGLVSLSNTFYKSENTPVLLGGLGSLAEVSEEAQAEYQTGLVKGLRSGAPRDGSSEVKEFRIKDLDDFTFYLVTCIDPLE